MYEALEMILSPLLFFFALSKKLLVQQVFFISLYRNNNCATLLMYNFPLFTLCLIDSLSLVRHTCMTDLSELEVEREISLDMRRIYT